MSRPTRLASARRRQMIPCSHPLHSNLDYYPCPLHSPAAQGPACRLGLAVRQVSAGAIRRARQLSNAASLFRHSVQLASRMAAKSTRWLSKAFHLPPGGTSNGAGWHDRCGNTNGCPEAFDPLVQKGNRPPRAPRRAIWLREKRPREDWRRSRTRISQFGFAYASPVMIPDISRTRSQQRVGSQ